MFRKFKKLLEEIQNSDETTKKRWLIGAAAISTFLVIGLWLVYIKSTLEFSGESVKNQESVVGFWQIFKNGLTIVSQSIKEGIKTIISEITKGKTITIE
jgi:hypothetical protein